MKCNKDCHHRFIGKFSCNKHLTGELDPRWNCLDGEDRDIDDIWQLHFTCMSTHPWKPSWFTGDRQDHPRQDIVNKWYELKSKALNNGYQLAPPPTDPIIYNIIGH